MKYLSCSCNSNLKTLCYMPRHLKTVVARCSSVLKIHMQSKGKSSNFSSFLLALVFVSENLDDAATAINDQLPTTTYHNITRTHQVSTRTLYFPFLKKKNLQIAVDVFIGKIWGFLLFIFRSKEAYLLRYKGEGISALNICAYTNR